MKIGSSAGEKLFDIFKTHRKIGPSPMVKMSTMPYEEKGDVIIRRRAKATSLVRVWNRWMLDSDNRLVIEDRSKPGQSPVSRKHGIACRE